MAKQKTIWCSERHPNKGFETKQEAEFDEALGLLCDGSNSLYEKLISARCGVDVLKLIGTHSSKVYEILDKLSCK